MVGGPHALAVSHAVQDAGRSDRGGARNPGQRHRRRGSIRPDHRTADDTAKIRMDHAIKERRMRGRRGGRSRMVSNYSTLAP
jgi:hypothetical protein